MVQGNDADILIVGAGAAGLMAGISAGRALRERGGGGGPSRIIALDGAKKIGVKILVAGGGRCNVTHHAVDEGDYAGGSKNAIRSVLRRFGVEQTARFFAELGVELKREDTGKLFPTTDRAQTVLDALLRASRDAGAEIRHPARVTRITRTENDSGGRFVVGGDWGELTASRLILATGGKALPRSGSDGGGYALARGLGHSITDGLWPALVPLRLADGHVLRSLSGVATRAGLELRSGTNKRLISFTNDTLCTHFGLSGPGPMDVSRHLTAARRADADAGLFACWLPGMSADEGERTLLGLGKRSVGRWLRESLPERLAVALCEEAGIEPATPGSALTREQRRAVRTAVFEMPLPVTGDRGYTHAEATAGGVPLGEIAVSSMSSKRCPGLFLCGEICDVDGRIGGYNFQWAWASGHLAGRAAAESLG